MKRTVTTASLIATAATAFAHDWNGIAIDPRGSIYVVDADSSRIWKVSPDGKVKVHVDVPAASALHHPHHLSIDGEGTLWLGSG